MNDPATLVEALDANQSDRRAIHYISDPNDERRVSFTGLRERALGLLHHFRAAGLEPGSELILYTNNNEQFIDGFWACLYGGIVPVPVAVGISDEHRKKLFHVFGQLHRPAMYSDYSLLQRLAGFGEATGRVSDYEEIAARTIKVEEIRELNKAGAPVSVNPADTAFIQYSSGTTGNPKGVVLSHANLMTNVRGIALGADIHSDDHSLSWMPVTHDMGLIALHLCMVVSNVSHTIMDTRLFSRRPLLWLKEASARGATILGSPNFGYKHFLKVYESKGMSDVDLSRVRVIWNGAEPISVPLCERFLDSMAGFGLPRSAMRPGYGLAEASVAVSMSIPSDPMRTIVVDRHSVAIGEAFVKSTREDPDALLMPILGPTLDGCETRIADDHDVALADGHVGHIQLRGGNVTAGYYEPAANLDLFSADGWLRTGDLGALINGELVVTGRHKDIIFANGQNYYPHDVEAVAEQVDGVELGKIVVAAARPADREEDQLVAFLLYRSGLDGFLPLAARIRRRITEQTGLEVDCVVPVTRIPKTSSGKLQRAQLTKAYTDGEYDGILSELAGRQVEHTRAEAGTDLELTLKRICDEVLTDRRVSVEDDLFEIGISSLALAEMHERIDELHPDVMDIADFFDYPTLRALAVFLQEKIAR